MRLAAWNLSLGVALAIALPAASAPPVAGAKAAVHYGVYLQNSRVGSMVERTTDTRIGGKPAQRLDADLDVNVATLGLPVEQHVKMSYLVDQAGRPKSMRLSMVSAGRTTTIDAVYEARQVVCSVDAGGQKSKKIIPIPPGVTLAADPELADQGIPKVGRKSTVYFFEPLSMSIQKIQMTVVKSEARTVRGKKVYGFLVRSVNSMTGPTESWVDAKGELLEGESGGGLRLVREDPGAPATPTVYTPPRDFAVLTSVRTAVKLPDARRTSMLRVKISGIPGKDLVLRDERQKIETSEATGESVAATYAVNSRELPKQGLAVTPGARGKWLDDATYLGVNEPEIQRQAKEVVGAETDRVAAARKLRAWVKGHMLRPNNVATLRSATEILHSRDGVCRDYASLFTTLARAAGIPTRLCSGIVYFNDAFYYHAWAECQLTEGEEGWYPFDATLDTDFVDATHIKFAQGDPSDMFSAGRVVGQIKAEILDHGELAAQVFPRDAAPGATRAVAAAAGLYRPFRMAAAWSTVGPPSAVRGAFRAAANRRSNSAPPLASSFCTLASFNTPSESLAICRTG